MVPLQAVLRVADRQRRDLIDKRRQFWIEFVERRALNLLGYKAVVLSPRLDDVKQL